MESFIGIQQMQVSKSNSVWTLFSLNDFIFIIISQNKNVDSYKPIVREALQGIQLTSPNIKMIGLSDNQQAALYVTNYFDTHKSNKVFLQQKLAVVQSTLDYKYLQSLGLRVEYPTLQLSRLSASALSVSAVDWQSKTLRYLVSTHASIPYNLEKLI